jgi:YidC/Oxa1 family membrane protein insertase
VDDKRNLIIAVLLTGLILFGWPYVASTFFPTAAPPAVTAPAKTESATADSADIVAAEPSAKAIPLGDALRANPRVLVDTPKLQGSINLEGARIDDLVMPTHLEQLAKNSPPVRLFSPSGTSKAYFARFGWTGNGATLPTDKTVWTADGQKLTPSTPVMLSWTNPEGQTFEIRLSIDEHYMIAADQRFTNPAGLTTANVAPFGIISRKGTPADATSGGSIFSQIHIGPMGVFDGKPNYDWGYEQVAEEADGKVTFKTTGGWNGMTDKYWLAALIPDQKVSVNAVFKGEAGYNWAQISNAKLTAVEAGKTTSQTSRLFAGAKEFEELRAYTDKGIPYLDYAIDWGWFWFIAIPFLWVLLWLFGVFGNFGVAIIGLTIIVRLFMYPVAQKQFASMAQMRAVQPKMKAVQERWKDDKPRMQQEMMKLYKDEKVNPLAGCLPILLQIPIFFALYKILMLSIEMRHQPFILWLRDLSVPDPSAQLVFDLLGTGIILPPFIAIGLLPILLGVTMWLMQKLNPQPMDEVQKQVFAIMPWFLMFIMAPFAAGLQLYWVMSNIISIAQQKWLYSRHPILREQMAKEAEEKAREKAKA